MRRTSISLLILILMFFVSTALADVRVNLPDTTGIPNQTIIIPIKVSDLSGLEVYSYEFKLNFDAKVARFLGVDSARTLTEAWGVTWINDSNPNQILIGNYGVSPLLNSGVLIFLRFEIIGQVDDSTQLGFEDFQFNAGNPAATTNDGVIKINPYPVSVSFKSNVSFPVKILIDNIEKTLPFDTTLSARDPRIISAISPQYQSGDVRFIFHQWSDGKDTTHAIVPVSDTTFILYMHKQYLLSVQSEYGTTVGNGWYVEGTTAEFSVDSLAFQGDTTRYIFKKWEGVGPSSYSGDQRTVNIVMNSPATEIAHWGVQHSLKLQSSYGNPVGAGWYDQGDTVAIGVDSLASLVEGTRYRFHSWEGKGNGSYTGINIISNVIMFAPIVETVRWNTEHYLWIESDPDGLIESDKSGWYAKNSVVMTNKADESIQTENYIYDFQNWSIAGYVLSSNPALVLMDTSHIALANYKINSVRVTITANIDAALTIYVDGVRHAVPYEKFWFYKSKHTVGIDTMQMAADFKTRYKFDSWSDGGAAIHSVSADSAFILTAFLSPQYFLSVETFPAGLINFAEKGWYNEQDSVQLPEVPKTIIAGSDTFQFRGWQLDDKPATGNPVVVMDLPHSAIALYRDLFYIKGKITDSKGNRIPGVELILTGVIQDSFVIASGDEYYFNFLLPGNYTVTPIKEGFRFDPAFRQYPALESSLGEENFIGIDQISPQVTLIYPNGGENFQGGAIDSVIWLAEDNMGIDSIKIDFSEDGVNWRQIAALQPNGAVKYLWNIPDITSSTCKIRIHTFDYDGNHAFDLSDSSFSITSSTTVMDGAKDVLPERFEVHQNYPNPFNSETMIRFDLPEACHIVVRIFNVVGQEIVTLFDGKLSAGHHRMIWNGKDKAGKLVSSGVYLYQAELSSQVVTKKLLYVR